MRIANGYDQGELVFASARSARDAVIAAGVLAAIVSLAALALGIGQGAGMQRPLAIAIIGGLIGRLPLVLLVVPCLLAWSGAGRAERMRRSGDAGPPSGAGAV